MKERMKYIKIRKNECIKERTFKNKKARKQNKKYS